MDCDRFYFSVEAAERPGLAAEERAVIIGRDPRQFRRGIVTTANDAARALGIGSGMSAATALRLAPTALFLPPRHEQYARYSARVMAVLRDESPLVQQHSIDEAACAWPSGFLPEPALSLRERLLAETGLSVSLGLATSPLVAKMASELAKTRPDHLCLVPPGREAALLAPLPIRALVGVGPKVAARLQPLGIATIGDLAARPVEQLVGTFGRAYGTYLWEASRGIDASPLVAERVAKSIAAEHTFPTDTADRRALWRELRAQAEEVAGRLRAEGMLAREVAIKLRSADWQTSTRQMRLPLPTAEATELANGADELMRRHWDRRPLRLIGLRAGHLTSAEQPTQLPLPTPPAPPASTRAGEGA
ncbi:MAG TPA: DNA polymerase IV [Chloroflexota bacterium]